MSSASREFLLMREEEETRQLYVPSLPKKEVIKKAEEDVNRIVDGGEVDVANAFVDATRMSEYLATFVKAIKKHITPEEYGKTYELKNAVISFRGTGDRLDYEQDEVYCHLKELLKEREELLKTAYRSKEPIFDSEMNVVPIVGLKSVSKEVVTIKY